MGVDRRPMMVYCCDSCGQNLMTDRLIVHGDEQKKIAGLPVYTSPFVPEGKAFIIPWCEVDDCPTAICGGPHRQEKESDEV